MLFRPKTFEEAKKYNGARFRYLDEEDGDWTNAVIVQIPVDPVGTSPWRGLHLRIKGEDGSFEKVIEWAEFEDVSKCDPLYLPEEAVQDQCHQRSVLKSKGKAVANGRATIDHHAHLLKGKPRLNGFVHSVNGHSNKPSSHISIGTSQSHQNGLSLETLSTQNAASSQQTGKRRRLNTQPSSLSMWQFEDSATLKPSNSGQARSSSCIEISSEEDGSVMEIPDSEDEEPSPPANPAPHQPGPSSPGSSRPVRQRFIPSKLAASQPESSPRNALGSPPSTREYASQPNIAPESPVDEEDMPARRRKRKAVLAQSEESPGMPPIEGASPARQSLAIQEGTREDGSDPLAPTGKRRRQNLQQNADNQTGGCSPEPEEAAVADPDQVARLSQDDAPGPSQPQFRVPTSPNGLPTRTSRRDREPFTIQGDDSGPYSLVDDGPDIGSTGQLVSLTLVNFKNHSHLEVEFGRHMNFFCGDNGSGKTAILDGLKNTLATTKRRSGKQAWEYIKDHTTFSRSTVTLWNTGEDAIMPKRYGSKISVRREMRRNGARGQTSVWAILDEKGIQVSSRKDDVTMLLKAMNVNAANPIVCLEQETAKTFASSQAQSDVHKIYMEATQFDEIARHQGLAEMEIGGIKDQKKILDTEQRLKKRELAEEQAKMRELEQTTTIQQQILKIENLLAWTFVWQYQRISEDNRHLLEDVLPQKYAQVEERHAAAVDALNSTREAHRTKGEELEEFPRRLDALQAECQPLMTAFDAAQKEARNKRTRAHNTKRTLANQQNDIKTLQDSLASLRARDPGQEEDEASKLERALQEKITEVEAAGCAVSTAREEQTVAIALERKCVVAHTGKGTEVRAANETLREMQRSLAGLQQRQGGDNISAFAGRNRYSMGRFLHQVKLGEQQGYFQRPVLGPIGSYLSLRDDRWGKAIEHAIGGSFNTFLVHSTSDLQRLKELARTVRDFQIPTVIVTNYDKPQHDLSRSRIPAEMVTMFKVLQIQEFEHTHVIANILVDQYDAERRALVPSKEAGLAVIRSSLGRAGEIHSAWDPDAGYAASRGQNDTSFAPPYYTIRPRLQKDISVAIATMGAQIHEQSQFIAGLNAELRALQRDREEARQGVTRARYHLDDLKRKKLSLDRQVEEIKTQQATQVEEDSVNLDSLAAQLATATEQLESLQKKLEDEEKAIEDANKIVQERKDAIETKRAEIAEREASFQGLIEESNVLERQIQEVEGDIGEVIHIRQQLDERAVEFRAAKAEADNKLADELPMAQEISKEDDARELDQELEDDFQAELSRQRRNRILQGDALPAKSDILDVWRKTLREKIKSQEARVGLNLRQVKVRVANLQKDVTKRGAGLDSVTRIYHLLGQGLLLRKNSIERMKIIVQLGIQNYFHKFLCMRGFGGGVDITEDKLIMKVRMGEGQTIVKDLRTLSGGEKSFVNLCFIMAVGQFIQSPFHCMDEFDVYMDAVNRRKSVEMLIRFAMNNTRLQLLLLSPLGTHVIADAKNLISREKPDYAWDGFIHTKQMYPPRA